MDLNAIQDFAPNRMSNLTANQMRLPPEQEAIREKCFHPTGTFVEFTNEETEQSIPQRFEKIARLYPERLALKTKNQQLTYAELNHCANRLARAILARRGEGQEPIALVLPKGAALIVAMFGVLKAGKIFMPLDPALPHARLSYLMEDAQAGLIMTNHDCIEVARDLTQHRDCIDIDDTDAGLGAENPGLSLGPDMLACILYTSVQPDFPRALSKIIAT